MKNKIAIIGKISQLTLGMLQDRFWEQLRHAYPPSFSK